MCSTAMPKGGCGGAMKLLCQSVHCSVCFAPLPLYQASLQKGPEFAEVACNASERGRRYTSGMRLVSSFELLFWVSAESVG